MNRARHPRPPMRIVPLLALILGASVLGAALPGGGVVAAAVAPQTVAVPPITACSAINKRKIIITRTSIGIQGAVTTKNWRTSQWAAAVLDPMYRLSSSYRPTNLVRITWRGVISTKGGYWLKREAADALSAMFVEAKASNISLKILSAYRSYATQRAIFAKWVAKSGLQLARKYSAVPGHSEHQLGTTVDLGSLTGVSWSSPKFPTSQTALWLEANAYKFGFVRSYPAGSANVALSCYGAEAWHWRYVGKDLAYEIVCSAQVPRIFLWNRQNGGERVIGPACDSFTPPEGYVLPSPSPTPPASEVPTESPSASPTESPTASPTETPVTPP
ncbi:MAG: D-alanyl-D-alanine carboxypeptidase family protein [Chloroflexi bacterium]|nr:D-alanyl-D-alanine carboxypeptidase family protein [Chloroflexota bacterium]